MSDFGRCAVKSDGDFGRCALNSDVAANSDDDFGRCVVNSDAQLSNLSFHYFGRPTNNYRLIRMVILNGDFGR